MVFVCQGHLVKGSGRSDLPKGVFREQTGGEDANVYIKVHTDRPPSDSATMHFNYAYYVVTLYVEKLLLSGLGYIYGCTITTSPGSKN